MDALADYIADNQYSAAISQNTSDCDVDYTKIITEDIPTPPFATEIFEDSSFYVDQERFKPKKLREHHLRLSKQKLNIYENTLKSLKDLAVRKFVVDGMLESTIGRYFLSEAFKAQQRITAQISMSKKGNALVTALISEKDVSKILKLLDSIHDFESKNDTSRKSYCILSESFEKNKPVFLDEVIEIFHGYSHETEIDEESVAELVGLENVSKPEKALATMVTEIKSQLAAPLSEAFETFLKLPKIWQDALCIFWYLDCRIMQHSDYTVFRTLGRGAFGEVAGARNKFTGKMIALKGMNRKLIKGKDCKRVVCEEKAVLEELDEHSNKFLIHLICCFHDKLNIYLGLPLMTGGDLSYHLGQIFDHFLAITEAKNLGVKDRKIFEATFFQNLRGFGVELATFYSAQILLGIAHLHSLGILYRDLKPENILLDCAGNIKITDLGLARKCSIPTEEFREPFRKGRTGTPGYWSPEMILDLPYGFETDWWSFGCTLYELFYGMNPFNEKLTKLEDRNAGTLKHAITFQKLPLTRKNCLDEILGFDLMEGEGFELMFSDFLEKLLKKDRDCRLGVETNPVPFMMNHELFKNICFVSLLNGNIPSPWRPKSKVNAETQSEIAVKNEDDKFKKLKLDEDDNWVTEQRFFSRKKHENEILETIKLRKKGKLEHLNFIKKDSTICLLS